MSSRSYEKAIQNYLKKFQAKYVRACASGRASTELATRPETHGLVEELVRLAASGLVTPEIQHDTTATPGVRPDWCITDPSTFGVFCYGDHKGLQLTGLLKLAASEEDQMRKYLRLGRPVFVFDGIEFMFLNPAVVDPIKSARRTCLIPKPLRKTADWSTQPVNPLVLAEFKTLISVAGFRKYTEEQLIQLLALRARLLSDEIRSLLELPPESGRDLAEENLIRSLADARKQLSQHHDQSLNSSASCADFISQVLIFGLFYAHTQAPRRAANATGRQKLIRSFWNSGKYRSAASKLRPFHALATLLDSPLNHANRLAGWYQDTAAFLAHAEYQGKTGSPGDFHTLFESFFRAFNPELAFEKGAFYTPSYLADWIARFAEYTAKRNFGQSLRDSAEKVIDPCLGTGGLVEALLNVVKPNPSSPMEIVGFEVMPAPYMLAQYRLASAPAAMAIRNKIHIFLTDTLSDGVEVPPVTAANKFDEELIEASKFASPPVRLVIGNPPSSVTAASGAPRQIIEAKMDDFRPPTGNRTSRQNTQKAIRNEAYRFLRWAAEKVLASKRGILAFVLPGAFIDTVSLRFAREWLTARFDEIWVLEVDEDARTGCATESVFQVLQGRIVLIAVSGTGRSKARHFLSIAGLSLHDKEAFFSRTIDASSFAVISGPPDQLAPSPGGSKALWDACWPLSPTPIDKSAAIFRLKCSGLKVGATAALFHTDRAQLLRRSSEIARTPLKPYAELKETWFKGQRGLKTSLESKLTPKVRSAIGVAVKSVVSYTYRPFVNGHCLLEDKLIGAIADVSSGARCRPEVVAAFDQGAVGILVAPGPKDLGNSLTRFVSFAPTYPDNDNVKRNNAMVYCDAYPANPGKQRGRKSKATANISAEALALFGMSRAGCLDTLFYVYGVMSCSAYLKTFNAELFVKPNPEKPFRVPFAKSCEVRKKVALLGHQLAKCEDFSIVISPHKSLRCHWPSSFGEFPLKKTTIDAAAGQITLEGDAGEVVTVLGAARDELTFEISGYNVVESWLRERTLSYLRRTFRKKDLEALCDLLSRIEKQNEILEEINKLVSPLLASGRPDNLIAPSIK